MRSKFEVTPNNLEQFASNIPVITREQLRQRAVEAGNRQLQDVEAANRALEIASQARVEALQRETAQLLSRQARESEHSRAIRNAIIPLVASLPQLFINTHAQLDNADLHIPEQLVMWRNRIRRKRVYEGAVETVGDRDVYPYREWTVTRKYELVYEKGKKGKPITPHLLMMDVGVKGSKAFRVGIDFAEGEVYRVGLEVPYGSSIGVLDEGLSSFVRDFVPHDSTRDRPWQADVGKNKNGGTRMHITLGERPHFSVAIDTDGPPLASSTFDYDPNSHTFRTKFEMSQKKPWVLLDAFPHMGNARFDNKPVPAETFIGVLGSVLSLIPSNAERV